MHLLREGCEIFALDADPDGVEHVRQLSESLGTGLPAENFQVGSIERMPFPDGFADVVICNSVLHFARDDRHFQAMLRSYGECSGRAGCCSAALVQESAWTSSEVRANIFIVGDGSEWFLVDEEMLLEFDRRDERGAGGSVEDDDRAGLSLHDDLGAEKAKKLTRSL